MNYDDPNEDERTDEDRRMEDGPTELDLVYDQLRDALSDVQTYRNALAGLYGLIKLIYVGADPADEIRRVLATNHRSIAAADALGVDRLDEPKF